MVAYSLAVLNEDRTPLLRAAISVVLIATWLTFLVDYIVRWILSGRGQRAAFVRHNPIDLLSVILPVFRALRVVSLLQNIPYFHVKTPAAVRIEIVSYAAAYAVLYVYFLALATLSVERDAPGATITSFGNAVWWACVTIATVGYGDTYPVTVMGRVYAVLLMAGGVAIIGTASALVISYITERTQQRMKRPHS